MKLKLDRVLIVLLLSITTSFARGEEPKLAPIYNGKDLTGWKTTTDTGKPDPIETHWTIKDGIIVGESDEKLHGSLLQTEAKYKNFVIELDSRWNGNIDTGIFVRKPNLQMQMGISRGLKKDMTCSFYIGGRDDPYPEAGRGKEVDKIFKVDDWNHYRLECKDNTFTVFLNEKKVSEYTNEKYSDAGPISLQIHPNVKMKVEFRDIKVAELK